MGCNPRYTGNKKIVLKKNRGIELIEPKIWWLFYWWYNRTISGFGSALW
jgi:hypothetical protein